MQGFIYVLSNPAMPGLVKIGFTTGTVQVRRNQLYATGVPTEFVSEYELEVSNCRTAEKRVHDHVKHRRFNKEFFRISPAEAIAEIWSLDLPSTRSWTRPELVEKVENGRKTIEDRENEKQRSLAARAAEQELVARDVAKRSLAFRRVSNGIGWPLGILFAIFTTQVVPESFSVLGKVVLGITAGSLSGFIVGWLAAELVVSKIVSTGYRGSNVANQSNFARNVIAESSMPVEQRDVSSEDESGFRFKWWYWLLIPPALKALSMLGRAGG